MYRVQRLIQIKTNLSKSTCNLTGLELQLLLSMHNFVIFHRDLSDEMRQLFTVTEGVEFE